MSGKISVATYLFRQLKQNGVNAIHGVPGDFTLRAIDQLKAAGIKWVGTCNELNAGYAADGYARIKGLGALLTTYGVGELSAINAVAGSFSENVPVVHIVGTPSNDPKQANSLVHHALPTRPADVFAKMHQSVTFGQFAPTSGKAACEKINASIQSALRNHGPVYIQLSASATDTMVSESFLTTTNSIRRTFDSRKDTEATRTRASDLVAKLQHAKFPLLLVDRGRDMDAARNELNHFVRHSGIPTLTMPSGASMIDHDIPNYLGVHSGPVGQIDTMPLIQQADLVLAFGPMFSDTQTLGWTTVPHSSKTIQIPEIGLDQDLDAAGMPDAASPISTSRLLTLMTESLEPSSLPFTSSPPDIVTNFPDFRKLPEPEIGDLSYPIHQTAFYQRVNSYLRPHDIILLGNATPILGGRDFILPSPTCRVISSGVFFSIGHMLPAALGAAVAQQHVDPSESSSESPDGSTVIPDSTVSARGRVVLFDGDGSFQVTAQELSTIIRLRLNVTIFILNNAGYAYERLIHGLHEDYNDIAEWDYLSLPAVFGGREALKQAAAEGEDYSISCACLKTWDDLDDFLQDQRFDNGFEGPGKRGLKLVDVRVGRTDVPARFKGVFEMAGERLRSKAKNGEEMARGPAGGGKDKPRKETARIDDKNGNRGGREEAQDSDMATTEQKKKVQQKDEDKFQKLKRLARQAAGEARPASSKERVFRPNIDRGANSDLGNERS